MVTLANAYPAGMRVSAEVALALVKEGRVEEAVNAVVYLRDKLNPDGSEPRRADGIPETSQFCGDQVKAALAVGFRDPDSIPVPEAPVAGKKGR